MQTLKIFIGYDPKEAVAFHVLCHSLLERSSKPISISPINLSFTGLTKYGRFVGAKVFDWPWRGW